ncbi:hypothetical protein BGX27_002624 [Mortierella sp. AM989]|nr:hypothetical protein BGX27_002624 [Mortierella sp. AM989]
MDNNDITNIDNNDITNMDNNDIMDSFFLLLKQHNLSLSKFLLKLFVSRKESVHRRVIYFYRDNGHGDILDVWNRDVPKDKRKSLNRFSIETSIRLMDKELKSLNEDLSLKCSASDMSHDWIENFSLDNTAENFKSKAPALHRVLTTIAQGGNDNNAPRKIPTIVLTVGYMLLHTRNRATNFLQMMFGLYLYSSGARGRVIRTLSHAGLSVSYDTIQRALRRLSQDAIRRIRNAVRTQDWFLIYDNINLFLRKSNQRINNHDSVENGTNATIILGGGIGPSIVKDPYLMFHPRDLLSTKKNRSHFRKAYTFHLIAVLKKYCDNSNRYTNLAPAINELPVSKTTTFPLPTLKIDESKVEGNMEILKTVMEDTLQLPENWFKDGKQVIVSGDHMTITRLRTLKLQRQGQPKPYDRLDWIFPLMQLFHLQMLLVKTIVCNYYGRDDKYPGSIRFNNDILERKRISYDKQDFYTAVEFLLHSFEALVLRLWEIEFGCRGITQLKETLESFDDATLIDRINSGAENITRKCHDELPNQNSKASVNAAYFLKDMALLLELFGAIRSGDIGRIEEALKWLTVMFQAGHAKNYAYELLHVHCALHYASNRERKESIMSSWLVNTTGRRNRWLAADLYQEHNNLITKVVHQVRGSNSPWEVLAEMVSPNINALETIRSQVEESFDTTVRTSNHVDVRADEDIESLLLAIRDHGILDSEDHPCTEKAKSAKLVKDLYLEGVTKLQSQKRFDAFVKRNMNLEEDDEDIIRSEVDSGSYIEFVSNVSLD